MQAIAKLFDDQYVALLEATARQLHQHACGLHLPIEVAETATGEKLPVDDRFLLLAKEINRRVHSAPRTGFRPEIIDALLSDLRRIAREMAKYEALSNRIGPAVMPKERQRDLELMRETTFLVAEMIALLHGMSDLAAGRKVLVRFESCQDAAACLATDRFALVSSGTLAFPVAAVLWDLTRTLEAIVSQCVETGDAIYHVLVETQ